MKELTHLNIISFSSSAKNNFRRVMKKFNARSMMDFATGGHAVEGKIKCKYGFE